MKRVEILTVGLVIGLAGVVSAVAIMSARSHARDVARLAHMREMQIGLELYFNQNGSYPVVQGAIALGEPTTACLSEDGFTAPCATGSVQAPFVEFVPSPPTQGLSGKSSCSGLKNAYCYQTDGSTFRMTFELEAANNVAGLKKGANCASESGFRSGACPAY